MPRPGVRLSYLYQNKQLRAIEFRRKGYSYQEIAKSLEVSKSTAYYWTKQVRLSKRAQRKIEKKIKDAIRKGIVAYNKKYAKIRSQEAIQRKTKWKEKAYKEILQELKTLSRRDLMLLSIAIYWAEGYTRSKNVVRVSNSDPFIIRLMMRFFQEICQVPKEKIRATVHLYPQADIRKALRYWSKVTGLPMEQFTKPQVQISRSSKRKRDSHRLPYGTLHLNISSTELTWKIKGWIQGIGRLI